MKKILGLLVVGMVLAGCSKTEQDSPKAETTVKVDLDGAKDSLKKTLNDAERKIEAGAKEAKAKLEDAGDKIKDKLDQDKKAEIKVEVKK